MSSTSVYTAITLYFQSSVQLNLSVTHRCQISSTCNMTNIVAWLEIVSSFLVLASSYKTRNLKKMNKVHAIGLRLCRYIVIPGRILVL